MKTAFFDVAVPDYITVQLVNFLLAKNFLIVATQKTRNHLTAGGMDSSRFGHLEDCELGELRHMVTGNIVIASLPQITMDTLPEDICGNTFEFIRISALQHSVVAVVIDPHDYVELVRQIKDGKPSDRTFRRELAAKAFEVLAAYDATVAGWLRQQKK